MNLNATTLEARACPACGSDHADTRHTAGPWRIVACQECGFIYLPVAARTDYFTEGEGAWESSIREKRARDLKETPIAARLSMATRFRTKYRKRTPVDYIMASLDGARDSKRAVLDIGCGAGDYLTSLIPVSHHTASNCRRVLPQWRRQPSKSAAAAWCRRRP